MILVLVEHDDGKLRPASRDVLAVAHGMASTIGEPVHVVAIGEHVGVIADMSKDMPGVASLHAISIEGAYAPAAWAQATADLATELAPSVLMAAATDRGQEILSYVGAKTGLPMIANAIEVEMGEVATVTREQWGGTLLEQVRCTASPLLTTISPAAAASATSATGDAPAVEERTVTPTPADLRVRLKETVVAEGAGVSLPEARVVVGGGRGVGDSAHFAELEALANRLGGAIGVSRAVTSAGWRPHAEQIGQTGVRIAPELYISCGVSGASQHMVGCLSAKHILAINTDADAPIMARADYAVIGDLHQIVPAITAELERRS